MQTFMTSSNFTEVSKMLDNKRLGKQRLESIDIYAILQYPNSVTNMNDRQKEYLYKRYRHHPIVKMWKGYEKALLIYGLEMCKEWINRGFNSTIHTTFENELNKLKDVELIFPDWINNIQLNISHQSNLLRKNKDYYIKYFNNVQDNLPYIWINRGE